MGGQRVMGTHGQDSGSFVCQQITGNAFDHPGNFPVGVEVLEGGAFYFVIDDRSGIDRFLNATQQGFDLGGLHGQPEIGSGACDRILRFNTVEPVHPLAARIAMVGVLTGILDRIRVTTEQIRIQSNDDFGLIQVINHRAIGGSDGIQGFSNVACVNRFVLDDRGLRVLLKNFLEDSPETRASRRFDEDCQPFSCTERRGAVGDMGAKGVPSLFSNVVAFAVGDRRLGHRYGSVENNAEPVLVVERENGSLRVNIRAGRS